MNTPMDWFEFRPGEPGQDQIEQARARVAELRERITRVEPIRTPRGLDSVLAAFPATMTHHERVAVLDAPQPDLDGLSPMDWLRDDGSASVVIAALIGDNQPILISQLVATISQRIGRKLVAYIASEPRTSTIRAWEDGTDTPGEEVTLRLSATFYAIDVLQTTVSDDEIQVWLQGQNDVLNDVAPARELREGRDPAAVGVVAAARRYVAHASPVWR